MSTANGGNNTPEPADEGSPTGDGVFETLIIGPPGSGKTWLLSALEVDAVFSGDQMGSAQYEIFAENAKMLALGGKARQAVRTGSLQVAPSNEVTHYTFLLREKRTTSRAKGAFGWRGTSTEQSISEYNFTLVDGPGESIFSDHSLNPDHDQADQDKFRAELVECGRRSQGLILCVDASDVQKAAVFFEKLRDILGEIGREYPFRRVAICLTKADLHFMRHGHSAEAQLRQTSPWPQARELMTDFALRSLKQYLGTPGTTIACGWASVYGFVLHDGSANYDKGEDRLLVYDERNPGTINLWRPFRLLDPFVFVATGHLCNLEMLTDEFLNGPVPAPRAGGGPAPDTMPHKPKRIPK